MKTNNITFCTNNPQIVASNITNIPKIQTCYIRFFADDLHQDFIEMVELFNRKEQQIDVDEEMGTYVISAVDGKQSVFDLIMHKYMSYAKLVRTDGDEKYHPLVCSLTFIGIIERPAV